MSELRNQVIKLAHSRPELRGHLLPLLSKQAMEFGSQDELEDYLREHPGANKANHSVKQNGKKNPHESAFSKHQHLKGMAAGSKKLVEHILPVASLKNKDHVEAALDVLEAISIQSKRGTGQSLTDKEHKTVQQGEASAKKLGLHSQDIKKYPVADVQDALRGLELHSSSL